MDESNEVSTLDFPSLPTPPGFHRIIRPGDTPELASSPLLFDSSPKLPGWYPVTHPVDVRDGPTLQSPIIPIACVSPGVSDICMSSPSSVVSDGSDGDVGLLSALLGPHSFRLSQHKAGSSDFSSSGAMDVPANRIQIGSPESCSTLAFGSGGPVLIGDFAFGCGRFRGMDVPIVGLCTTFSQIWTAFAPPPVLGVDRRSGVCSSAGSGP